MGPRSAAAAILIAGCAASLVVNYPGHLEFDGIMQLAEGHTGIYSNWHPPVMSWLLGLSDGLRGDAWLFVLLDTLTGFGALLSLLWLVERPRWPAVGVAFLCAVLPQFFLFEAIVWKDVLFADAALAGFVFLAHAGARWQNRRMRFALLAGAVLFIALAVLTRQNGAVVLPCAAIALGAIAAKLDRARWRDGLRYGLGFLALCALLCVGANALLQLRASKALGAVEQFEDLQIYDIAGMLAQNPDLPLPILEREDPAMAKILRDKGPKLYTPAMHDPLTDSDGFGRLIIAGVAPVKHQWLALVKQHPLMYLAVRWADFSWVFFSLHPDQCMTYSVGVDGPAEQMALLKLPHRADARDDWLDDKYGGAFIGTPVFSHPFFALIGLVCLVLLLRRRRPADLAMAGLLLSAALYTASYFIIAIACEYRYLFVIDTSAMAAALYLAADWPRLRPPAPSA